MTELFPVVNCVLVKGLFGEVVEIAIGPVVASAVLEVLDVVWVQPLGMLG